MTTDLAFPQDPVLTENDGPVGIITLNCPERSNALDEKLATYLLEALRRVLAHPEIRCVLLKANGKFFGVGGDLETFTDEAQALAKARRLLALLHAVVRTIREAERVVISAVQGTAAGGSLSLALACDLSVWASNAKLVPAYASLGATPDCGLTWTLARVMGSQRALDWLLDGRAMTAIQAHSIGLVQHVVEADALYPRALAIAHHVADLSPRAVAGTKRLLEKAGGTTLAEQLDAEKKAFESCVESQEFREKVRAFVAGTRREHRMAARTEGRTTN